MIPRPYVYYYNFTNSLDLKHGFSRKTDNKNARLLREIRFKSFLSNCEGGGIRLPVDTDVGKVVLLYGLTVVLLYGLGTKYF